MVKTKQATAPALMLRSVTRQFSAQHWIGPFSLEVPPGTFLTLLGPSGCGKTTILRIIAGLESVDGGQVHLFGEDITHVPPERRPVNTVFQRYALFPHMSVAEDVEFGLRMQGMCAEERAPRVAEALQWVQLERLATRLPESLSGGQQQRVAIARAVVNQPKVLLLDEPLSALDYRLRRRLQNELKALQRQLGIPFIFVTHDQEEALSLSDHIVVMRDGLVEQAGAPRAIYEEPANLFVAQFVGESNVFDATVQAVDVVPLVWANIEHSRFKINVKTYLKNQPDVRTEQLVGRRLKVVLRPEDLRIKEVNGHSRATGMVGYVRERNYRGMTLDSLIELESGKTVMVSEFFNENDPDVDHSLHQKVCVTWVSSWEMVLDDET